MTPPPADPRPEGGAAGHLTLVPAHDFEDVNLDEMTVEQLIRERADCWTEIQHIEAQLGDPTAIYRLGADDYVLWRKRAIWALRHRKIELHDIANALQERRRVEALERHRQEEEERAARKEREQAEKIERRRANGWDPDRPTKLKPNLPRTVAAKEAGKALYEANIAEGRRKREALTAALAGDGMDLLLVRLWVLIRHLFGDGEPLPDAVTDEDRHALRQFSSYLQHRYGKTALREVCDGTFNAARPPAIEAGEGGPRE